MSHKINPTDKNFPYKKDDTLKDSQVNYDSDDDIIIVDVPVILPKQYRPITATTTILSTDQVIEVTSGSFSLVFPIDSEFLHKKIVLVNTGTGLVSVSAASLAKVSSFEELILDLNDSITVFFNGADWIVL